MGSTTLFNPVFIKPEQVDHFLSCTLDFNLLFKFDFECWFVSLECSLQSSEIRFEVRSDDY